MTNSYNLNIAKSVRDKCWELMSRGEHECHLDDYQLIEIIESVENPVSDWKPIYTAPKDGTRIDIWVQRESGEGWRECDCWFYHDSWTVELRDEDCHVEFGDAKAKYWMPIIEPPKDM